MLLIPENNIRVNNQLVVIEPVLDIEPSIGRRLKKSRY